MQHDPLGLGIRSQGRNCRNQCLGIWMVAFLRNKPFLAAVGDFDARPYDAGKVPHPLWQFQVLPKIGRELKEEDFPHIGEIIKNIADDPAASENRRLAKEKAWQYQGQAGKRIAEYMVQVQQEVSEA